ncbi:hypothetical protein [Dactylosporangium sp. CA-092794]|uniref:hypothetical protein n=1 Tax=Dactylosporangium sp. CA-092794 TaxID=3239929 RepID=UPI003D8AE651
MAQQIQVDEASTAGLLNAFNTAMGDQQSAHQAANGAHSELMGAWRANSATIFGVNMTEWMAGLSEVTAGLEMISGQMKGFAQDTDNTEGQNRAGAAGSWAL